METHKNFTVDSNLTIRCFYFWMRVDEQTVETQNTGPSQTTEEDKREGTSTSAPGVTHDKHQIKQPTSSPEDTPQTSSDKGQRTTTLPRYTFCIFRGCQ